MAATVPYPDHPDRCQGKAVKSKDGEAQCTYFKVEGSDYCEIHGQLTAGIKETQQLNLYRIKKFQKRLDEFKVANGARTLDEELALLRMVLEQVVNKCETEMDLLLYSSKIGDLISKIQTLVISADKLATKSGTLIGRSEAIVIAGKIIEIVSRFVTDPKTLSQIGDSIAAAFIDQTPIGMALNDTSNS